MPKPVGIQRSVSPMKSFNRVQGSRVSGSEVLQFDGALWTCSSFAGTLEPWNLEPWNSGTLEPWNFLAERFDISHDQRSQASGRDHLGPRAKPQGHEARLFFVLELHLQRDPAVVVDLADGWSGEPPFSRS